jgi:glycosyltransferase involved in cell wall biosynthesis
VREDGRAYELATEEQQGLTAGLPTYRLSRSRSRVPLTNLLLDAWALRRALREIAARHGLPDLIHAHIYSAGAPAVLAGRMAGLPTVVTEQSSGFPRRLFPPAELRKARLAFRGARFVLPVSLFLQRALEEIGFSARFEVVPNAVDERIFFPTREPRNRCERARLVFVGRLTVEKGIAILLDALARLGRDDWTISVVGDGPERATGEALVAARGLAQLVRFHGLLPKPEIAALLRRSDGLVLPTLFDNSPCVVLEALATGLPVLASRVGGLPELVDDTTGILVEPGNAEALVRGLAALLEGLPRFDKRKILERAHRYTSHSVGQSLLSIYEECVGRSGLVQRDRRGSLAARPFSHDAEDNDGRGQ